MLFTEPAFLFVFLPFTLLAYYLSPRALKNAVLALLSLLFYAVGEWPFVPWLVASTGLNYAIGLGLARWRGRRRATALLAFGVASDLALLVVFKYAGFFTATLNLGLAKIGVAALPVPLLPLPLGISFFTFHKISYKVDVLRGVATARKNPLDLMVYILLFPQLIAGPIVRYGEIAEALIRRHATRADFADGIRRFAVGMGKKMLVANTVAIPADAIFALPPGQLSTGLAWLGVLCYALQIYFDFSGYSDMAIGLARLFGFRFPENFDFPYVARSITEFWRRWHMSLSRWFRDYLYIPLGGGRVSKGRVFLNLGIVFFLCGLWHGARETFVVWGCFHGALLIVERLFLGRFLARIPAPFRHLYTLLAVLVGWVLFRADTLGQAGTFFAAMAGGGVPGQEHPVGQFLDARTQLAIAAGVLGAMPWLPRLQAWLGQRQAQGARTVPNVASLFGHALLLGVFALALFQVASGTYNPFIYFRF